MSTTLDFLKAEHIGARAFRNHLFEFLKDDEPLVITEHGRPVRIMLDYKEMLGLLDMLDELSDPETIEAICEGRKAIAAGTKGVPAADLIKKYKTKK
ncbi:MAG: type II toxin-antitoxin system prevent-host-death family antitoxin [Candidatus Omnitrophota bacterium]